MLKQFENMDDRYWIDNQDNSQIHSIIRTRSLHGKHSLNLLLCNEIDLHYSRIEVMIFKLQIYYETITEDTFWYDHYWFYHAFQSVYSSAAGPNEVQ
jgi:hypothetical protein